MNYIQGGGFFLIHRYEKHGFPEKLYFYLIN